MIVLVGEEVGADEWSVNEGLEDGVEEARLAKVEKTSTT